MMGPEDDEIHVVRRALTDVTWRRTWSPNTLDLLHLDEHWDLDVHQGRNALARSDSFATAWAREPVLWLQKWTTRSESETLRAFRAKKSTEKSSDRNALD